MESSNKPSEATLVGRRDIVFTHYCNKICSTWVLDAGIKDAIDVALSNTNYETQPICDYIDHYYNRNTCGRDEKESEYNFVSEFFKGYVPISKPDIDCDKILTFYNDKEIMPYKMQDANSRHGVLIDVIFKCYRKFNSSVETVMAIITEYVKQYPNACDRSIWECFTTFADNYAPTSSVPTTSTAHVVAEPTSDPIRNSFGILEQALMEVIKKQSIPVIEQDIKSECVKMLQDFIVKEYGTIERKIITVVNGEEHTTTGVLHEQFDTVLKFVQNDEPVFLSGPAGSGKNFICQQIAEVLGLKFYFSNAVTQEYKLIGFTDANGNYQPTQFYKAFTEGGLFMLDEIDASIPEVLVILNAAIANRYFDFPAPIGYKKAHPDFRVVAAGNTTGNGADYTYVGRNQLDGASLDRFAIVPIHYSQTIENNMAGDIELADFCREFRKASEKTGVQIITSYRAINRLAKMSQIMELPEALSTCLIKGLSADDINIICKELSPSKYKTALQTLAVDSSS